MNDDEFLRQFEDGSFPANQWHHREHIKVAYLYLLRLPLEAAIEQVRTAIRAHNAVHQVPESLDRGYHETMTQAWMRLVHFTLCDYGPADTADQFYEQHPQLWQAKALRFYYSRDRLLSWEAKRSFLEPDLRPFPEAIRNRNLLQ